MNAIDKVLDLISNALIHSGSGRYSVSTDPGGSTIILDSNHRIRVTVAVSAITVQKYNRDDGKLKHAIAIQWEDMSLAQRKKLIELMDSSEDTLDPEIEETLNQIFEGV